MPENITIHVSPDLVERIADELGVAAVSIGDGSLGCVATSPAGSVTFIAEAGPTVTAADLDAWAADRPVTA